MAGLFAFDRTDLRLPGRPGAGAFGRVRCLSELVVREDLRRIFVGRRSAFAVEPVASGHQGRQPLRPRRVTVARGCPPLPLWERHRPPTAAVLRTPKRSFGYVAS